VVREGVIAHFDFGVSGLDIVGFEGRTAHKASIGDDSQTPDIHFIGVSAICMI
jgi:hypothetical protein